MSSIKAKIRSLYPDLPKAETKVADFIANNPDKVPFLSVHECADAVEVSVASVSRFVRKIGFSHFKDFKIALAKDSGSGVPDIYQAINPADSSDKIVQKVFRGYEQSIEDTLKMLDIKSLIEISKIFSNTGRAVFFGIGGSGIVARDAALRFSHLDIQAEAFTDPLYILIQAKRIKRGELAIGISHSGRTKVICEALQLVKQRGAITVGISNYIKAPLSAYVQHLFCTSFPEDRVKAAALSSRIAQLCIIDDMYLLTAKHKKSIWDTESLNRLIENLLRLG